MTHDREFHIDQARRTEDEQHAALVQAEHDTRTRRITLPAETRRGLLEGTIAAVIKLPPPKPYHPGSVLQIMADDGPAVFTCTLVMPIWLTLGEAIPFDDPKRAKQLGASNPLDARRRFLYAHTVMRKLTDKQQAQITDSQIHKAWARWNDRPCWLLHLQPQDTDRYFASGVQHQTEQPEDSMAARGYTTNPNLAVDGEPACVDDTWLARYSIGAKDKAAKEIEDAKAALPAPRNAAEARKLRQARKALDDVQKGRAA